MRTRLILIISIVLLIIIIAAIGIYLMISGNNENIASNGDNNIIGLTEYGPQTLNTLEDPSELPLLVQLNDLPSDFLQINRDKEELVYFNNSSKQIFSANLLGYAQSARSDELTNLKNIIWSPQGNQGLLLFQTIQDAPYQAYIFNNDTLETKEIDGFFADLVWKKDGSVIYGYRVSSEGDKMNGIVSINPETATQSLVRKLTLDSVKLAVSGNNIAYYLIPSSLRRSSLYLYDLKTKKTTEILSGYYNLDIVYAPNNTKILFAGNTKLGKQPEIFVKDLKDTLAEPTALRLQTFAHKCVWNSNSVKVYCAVPARLQASRTLYKDYMEKKLQTNDEFWMVNTQYNSAELFIPAREDYYSVDANHLNISDNNQTLYFINRNDDYNIWATNLESLGV